MASLIGDIMKIRVRGHHVKGHYRHVRRRPYYGTTSKPASYQTGRSDYARDVAHHARLPGKRISRARRVYYEHRKNRSDLSHLKHIGL